MFNLLFSMRFIYEAGFSVVYRNWVVLLMMMMMMMMMMTMMMTMMMVVVVMNGETDSKLIDNQDNLLLREVFNIQ